MSRSLLASALLMCSGVAAAVPVQLDLVYSDLLYTNAVRAGSGPGEHLIGDAYTQGIVRDIDYGLIVPNASGGFGRAYTGIFQQVDAAGDDRRFDVSFTADLMAVAHLSGPVDADAYAFAETRFRTFGMQFEVLEPVLYTGTFGVFAQAWLPFENYYTSTFFDSGSILQPGTYAFTISPYLRDPSLWLRNEATTSGETVATAASANYGFAFATIPAPATLPLLALALGCVFVARYRARSLAS